MLTGAWNLSGGSNEEDASTTISFHETLTADPTVVFVAANTTNSICTGTAAEPVAPTGVLCVYEAYMSNLRLNLENRYMSIRPTEPEVGASRYGAAIYGFRNSVAVFGAWGTWAVGR